jgi:hypothetical protein
MIIIIIVLTVCINRHQNMKNWFPLALLWGGVHSASEIRGLGGIWETFGSIWEHLGNKLKHPRNIWGASWVSCLPDDPKENRGASGLRNWHCSHQDIQFNNDIGRKNIIIILYRYPVFKVTSNLTDRRQQLGPSTRLPGGS